MARIDAMAVLQGGDGMEDRCVEGIHVEQGLAEAEFISLNESPRRLRPIGGRLAQAGHYQLLDGRRHACYPPMAEARRRLLDVGPQNFTWVLEILKGNVPGQHAV